MSDEFVIGNEGEDREKPKVGTTRAICIGVYNIGWQKGFQGEYQKKVLYLWEIDQRLTTGENTGKRHFISQSFKQSMHEKSGHAKMLKNWRGADFTEEERAGHNVLQYINKPCIISLEASKDGKYVNVGTVSPMMDGMEPIKRETPANYTPEWILKRIEEGKSRPANAPEQTAVQTEEQPKTELDKARAAAKAAYNACKDSQLFKADIDAMKKALIDNGDNIPSLWFLARKWGEDLQKAKDDELMRANAAVP